MDLRREVVEVWRASGQTQVSFAEQIGVTGTTITNWERSLPKARPAKKPKFRRLRVIGERENASQQPRAFVLELGTGARVTGLHIEDLVRLLNVAGGGV